MPAAQRAFLGLVALIVGVATLGVSLWGPSRYNTSGSAPAYVSLVGTHTKGNRRAPVGVVEYSDFECSYCAQFAQSTQPALFEKYVASGRVLWSFRHFPLEKVHARAFEAAAAAECAGRHERFWEMHDTIFRNPGQLGKLQLLEYARRLGLKSREFELCLGGEGAARVRQDIASGLAVGVEATPTFLVGATDAAGERLRIVVTVPGARPPRVFEEILENALREVVDER